MIEQLRHKADTIKTVIGQQPKHGMDLLLDFARLYAVDEQAENDIVLCQFILASNTEGSSNFDSTATNIQHPTSDIENTEGSSVIEKLKAIADKIVENYDAEKSAAFKEQQAALAATAAKRQRQNDVVLVAENIQKTYKSSGFTLTVDKLELRLGEITGLVGENATGKTTLFRILAGDLAPQQGGLRYPFFNPKNKLPWTHLKLKIAYVPQELPTWEGSLIENLQFEAARHGIVGKDNDNAVAYIIQRLGLALHTHKSWRELSGGYKLRFALAKALVWKAQLLILDEPLAHLDIKTQMIVLNDLRDLAKSLHQPIAIIVSSQHLHEIEAVADQMLFMREGHLDNLGRTQDMGNQRTVNLFELACAVPFDDFTKQLQGFDYQKVWQNGMSYFISTPLSITGEKLLQHLAAQHIVVNYYRDVSHSVKMKFYETDI